MCVCLLTFILSCLVHMPTLAPNRPPRTRAAAFAFEIDFVVDFIEVGVDLSDLSGQCEITLIYIGKSHIVCAYSVLVDD